MRRGLLLLGFCLVLLTGFNLWAQTEGSITGTITDTSGAAIPSAKISVTNEGTHNLRVVNSDNAGVYDVPALVPGLYDISVEVKGFQTEQRKGLELQVQQAMRVDFKMQVGQVTQVIEVSGSAVALNTENATVGSVIENERIVELPLDGRNFLELTALDANVMYGYSPDVGAATSRMGGERVQMDISVAGGRPEFDYYTLDGISNTDVSFQTYTFLPSIDAIQEFKIQTGVFPAEFGRGAAQINVSTKPGTNNLHGSLFEFVRNTSTDAQAYCFNYAAPFTCPPGAILHQNQFGGVIGGPVYIPHVIDGRNKLFFMFDYEGFRTSQQETESGLVMTPAQRTGDYTEAGLATLYDPATRVLNSGPVTVAGTVYPAGSLVTSVQTFASECGGANMIPNGSNCGGIPSRIDPIASKLLAFEPMPTTTAPLGTNNLFDSFPVSQVNNQYTFRGDFNQNANSTWFGRWSQTGEIGAIIQSAIVQGNDTLATHAYQFVLSNVRTFSPTLVNDFRFGYNRLVNGVLQHDAYTGVNEVGALGGFAGVAPPYPAIYGVPSIGPVDVSSWGDCCGVPFLIFDNTFQWADTVAKVHGKHSLRIGADIRRDQFQNSGNDFSRGAFSYRTGGATSSGPPCFNGGVGSAAFLLGLHTALCSAQGLAHTMLRNTSQAYFIDDTWKVTPKLTISMGLRYEYVDPYVEKHNDDSNVWYPPANQTVIGVNPVTGGSMSGVPETDLAVEVRAGSGPFYQNIPANFQFGGGLITARTSDVPCLQKALYCEWKDDFAPRLGIAYSPSSNWVIRAGAGIFFTQDMNNYMFDEGRNLAARRQTTFNAASLGLSFEQPLGSAGGQFVTHPFTLAEGPNLHTPYLYQYLLDVQRQLTPTTMITVGYMGNMSHSLWKLIDGNDPPVPAPGDIQSRRPYPTFGVIQGNEPFVSGNYNALSVRISKKTSHGLSLNQVYTWSRDIDDGSAVREHANDSLFPQNPYDTNADRGLSNLHIEHRAVTSLIYDLPVGKGRAFLNQGGVANAILGGWQLGGILTLQTGFPYDILTDTDEVNNAEGGYDRPNYTGAPLRPPNPTIAEWINPAAYHDTTCLCYGNVGRDTAIGPWFGDYDANVMKRFYFREGMYLQIRFEGFNVTNHPNFGAPTADISASNFGQITGTYNYMRQLQLGLKFVY